MNQAQAQAILEAGGFSHLIEAAIALARLTGQAQLASSAEQQQTALPTAPSQASAMTTLQQVLQQVQQQQQPQQQTHNVILDDESQVKLSHQQQNPLSAAIAPSPPRQRCDTNVSSNCHSGSKEIFPERLMAILNDASLSEVITWLPHGRSFVIIRPDVFTETALPKYFPPLDARSSLKYTSFTRKLNRW